MPAIEVLALLAAASFLAGVAGSFLGIGGGVFLIPFMTLVLGVPLHVAIAVSLVGVIATSSGAASVYVRDRLTNLRLGMFLEIATTVGALAGAFVAVYVDARALFLTFAIVVFYAAVHMARTKEETAKERAYRAAPETRVSQRLRLGSVYYDQEDGAVYRYHVERIWAGFGVSAIAGAMSGLLGLGGGFVKVPAMNQLMRVPMKSAVATSNFMIGVTAAASAFVYYSRNLLDPALASMVVVGVFTGTNFGTRLMMKSRPQRIRIVFAGFLAVLAILMGLRAFLPGVIL